MKVIARLLSVILPALATLQAQESGATRAPMWQVRAFHLPPDACSFLGPEGEKIVMPPLPARSASQETRVAHLRECTGKMKKMVEANGILCPKGTAFLFDPDSGSLIARNSQPNLDAIETLVDSMLKAVPMHAVFTLDILESSGPVIRQMLKDAGDKQDHSAALKKLLGLARQGQAKHRESIKLESRSGQTSTLSTNKEHHHVSSVIFDGKGVARLEHKFRPCGLTLNMTPVIGPNGWNADANYTLEYHFAPPSERRVVLGQAGTLGELEAPLLDYHCMNSTGAVTTGDGLTELLQVWKPNGTAEYDKADILQAAFLHTRLVPLFSAPNNDLRSQFDEIADKAIPLPTGVRMQTEIPISNGAKPVIPKGMQMRKFKVPPDFLNMPYQDPAPPPTPPDPFGPLPVRDGQGNIFEMEGVHFPEGSYATFFAPTDTLIVVNTPENLSAMEAYVDRLVKKMPLSLSITLQIVQADKLVMQRLVAGTAGLADHGEVWQAVEDLIAQGKARAISTQCLETRSGQRARLEAGQVMQVAREMKKNEKGETLVELESRNSGTQMDVEPVIGPDGNTVDLYLKTEHHYAPPSSRLPAAIGRGSLQVTESADLDFHVAKLDTILTVQDGRIRLLNFWPAGSHDEFLQAAFLRVHVTRALKPDDEGDAP